MLFDVSHNKTVGQGICFWASRSYTRLSAFIKFCSNGKRYCSFTGPTRRINSRSGECNVSLYVVLKRPPFNGEISIPAFFPNCCSTILLIFSTDNSSKIFERELTWNHNPSFHNASTISHDSIVNISQIIPAAPILSCI